MAFNKRMPSSADALGFEDYSFHEAIQSPSAGGYQS
jgi:hypothetical protein